MPSELNEQNFEQDVLKSAQPVLVDFWADWCAPCHVIGPIVDKLSKDYQGKVKVAKVDIVKYPKLASQYQIMSIPQLLIFKEGKVVDQIIGAQPENVIREKLDKVLG